jgi:DnaK suppressor protein
MLTLIHCWSEAFPMQHPANHHLANHGFAPYKAKQGERYMNPDQETHFRAILNAWRRELMEEVDRTVDHMKLDSVHCPDPNDRATQEADIGLELRTRDRERKLLNKIDKTLRKLDDHEYGFCESCGVEIGIQRLEARPTADLCVDCKTREEMRER